jgi:tRNA threonylcarbamoyladenosine biosynthesis protein TsaE
LVDTDNPNLYLDDLDLDTENSVTVVEWGGSESARLNEDRLEITIDRTTEIRQVEIKAIGARWNSFVL